MEKIFLQSFSIIDGVAGKRESSLADLLKQSSKTILYFYPKDNTPGCSLENTDFSCLKEAFQKLSIQLIGVSKDSLESHEKFIGDHGIKNILISDPQLALHMHFGAYGEKNNYGKKVLGVIRSTFLLDSDGNIVQSWKNVKATGHAQKILKEVG